MLEKLKNIPNEWLNFLVKVVLVACVAMSVKIAIQMKKEKVSMLNIILSFVIGVGSAFLSGKWVLRSFDDAVSPIVIGAITIVGEKVGNWLVYTLRVDDLLEYILNYLKNKNK